MKKYIKEFLREHGDEIKTFVAKLFKTKKEDLFFTIPWPHDKVEVRRWTDEEKTVCETLLTIHLR